MLGCLLHKAWIVPEGIGNGAVGFAKCGIDVRHDWDMVAVPAQGNRMRLCGKVGLQGLDHCIGIFEMAQVDEQIQAVCRQGLGQILVLRDAVRFFKVQGTMVFHGDGKDKGRSCGLVQALQNAGREGTVCYIGTISGCSLKELCVFKLVDAKIREDVLSKIEGAHIGMQADGCVAQVFQKKGQTEDLPAMGQSPVGIEAMDSQELFFNAREHGKFRTYSVGPTGRDNQLSGTTAFSLQAIQGSQNIGANAIPEGPWVKEGFTLYTDQVGQGHLLLPADELVWGAGAGCTGCVCCTVRLGAGTFRRRVMGRLCQGFF